jgi:AcrR family transcriptional regulator
MTSSLPSDIRPTRRDRNRQAMLTDIKTLARQQLSEGGPGALSLRAIARQIGTAPSALYRYFANYDDLLSALCIDAYDAAADALIAARDTQTIYDHAGRWWAICQAYRRWALDNTADFALIFGTPVPGYQAPANVTGPAAGRIVAVALQIYVGAVAAGVADPNETQVPESFAAGELLPILLGETAPNLPPQLAGITLTAWTSVLGYLTAEIFGSLNQLVADTETLYQAHIRTIMLGMGFDPLTLDSRNS